MVWGGGTLLLSRTDEAAYPRWLDTLIRTYNWTLRRHGEFDFYPAACSHFRAPVATLQCWHPVPDGRPVRAPLAHDAQDPIVTFSSEDEGIDQFSE